jgi:hypothetical protein
MVKDKVKKWKCASCGKWHKPKDCDDVNYFEVGMRNFYGKEDPIKVYFPLFVIVFVVIMILVIFM